MNINEFKQYVESKLGTGPKNNEGDIAVKVWFDDIRQHLLSNEEIAYFFKEDILRRRRRKEFIHRLSEIVRQVIQPILGGEDYPSIIIYAIESPPYREDLDLIISLSKSGMVVSRAKKCKFIAGDRG